MSWHHSGLGSLTPCLPQLCLLRCAETLRHGDVDQGAGAAMLVTAWYVCAATGVCCSSRHGSGHGTLRLVSVACNWTSARVHLCVVLVLDAGSILSSLLLSVYQLLQVLPGVPQLHQRLCFRFDCSCHVHTYNKLTERCTTSY